MTIEEKPVTGQLYADPSLVPEHFGLDHKVERLIVVMPGYAADGSSARIGEGRPLYRCLGALWRVVTTASYRGFVRGYRDFYANPRSGAYMASQLSALADSALPGVDMLLLAVDMPALPEALMPRQDMVELVSVPSAADLHLALENASKSAVFDAALLLHHDAIGLGLAGIEATLQGAVPDGLFVLNGRRRVYRLDQAMRRRLASRRFLAETRIVELGLGLVIGVFARFSGRRQAAT